MSPTSELNCLIIACVVYLTTYCFLRQCNLVGNYVYLKAGTSTSNLRTARLNLLRQHSEQKLNYNVQGNTPKSLRQSKIVKYYEGLIVKQNIYCN
jgi:hypothetical protein